VEFIESQPFTRKLHRLAGDAADALLRAILDDLERKPERGAVIPGLGGVRKARIANPGRGEGKRGGTVICICTWKRGSTFTCCCYWTRMNKKMPRRSSVDRSGSGLRSLNASWEAENGEENQCEHF
jgi:hypothetical protein